MIDFNKAFKITLGHEGGYSNDPVDVGGETYKGISRRYNPSWKGWEIIDKLKEENPTDFKDILRNRNEKLNILVESFYKEHYWDRFWGDRIPSQDIGNELFDSSVNMGVHRGVKFLQKSLNLLNRNQKNYNDIVEDGVIGPTTLRTLKYFLRIDKSSLLLKFMNVLQGMHYINYMSKSPRQERFARGWFNRVSI